MSLLHILGIWLGLNIWLVFWAALRGVAAGVRNVLLEEGETFNGYLPPRAGERS